MPYITASIVVQLGGTLYGPWQALRKEGETGRKKLNQYTRYLTVAITLVQGYLAVRGLESQRSSQGINAVVAARASCSRSPAPSAWSAAPCS